GRTRPSHGAASGAMTRVPPAKPPIRVALLGFGYWGPNYARVLHELPQVELTIVCDKSVDRLAQVRQRYPGVATSGNVDEALGRADIDAVVIATPASTHQALVEAVLRSGRHVLVEKPMSLEVAGCDVLCD